MLDSPPAAARAARPPDVRLDTSLEMLIERGRFAGTPVLATLVSTAGSTYRKHGARMLIEEDGSYLGLLSGGCLESDLVLHAAEVRQSGTARAIEYDMRGPDDVLFGIGAGCEGAMRILLEPAGPGSTAARALSALHAGAGEGREQALVMVHESGELPLGTYHAGETLPARLKRAAEAVAREHSTHAAEWPGVRSRERALIQWLAPVPHLLVCGAGPDAESVVAAARFVGWRVTVVDHRPAYARGDRFPGATVLLQEARALRHRVDLAAIHAAVVMSHHLNSDTAYLLELAAAAGPGYIGLLGPSARRGRIEAELGPAAVALENRLRGPVGLDLGAATPESIALAIIGQIHAWLAGRRSL